MKRENNFDFIRLFAAFCVMVYHAVYHLDLQFLWLSRDSGVWFMDGVAAFFIMSGMLVYYSYQRSVEKGRPISHYYINRFLRVAPAIYIYTLSIIIILILIKAINFDDIVSFGFLSWLVSNIVLIPVYHPETFSHIGVGVLNGSLWTIPVEFSFYLIVPLIFVLQKRIGFIKMLIILITIWLLSIIIIMLSNSEFVIIKLFSVSFFPHLIYFALGIFFVKYWNKVPKNGTLALFILIAYCTINYTIFNIESNILYTLLSAIFLSYLVLWFGNKGPLFLNKIIEKIGDLSFGVYIWHMVVVNLFLYFQLPEKLSWLNDNLVLLLVFSISFILAYLSWNLIEKPALKLKPYNSRNEINKQLAK